MTPKQKLAILDETIRTTKDLLKLIEAAMYVEDVVWRVRMKQLEVDR